MMQTCIWWVFKCNVSPKGVRRLFLSAVKVSYTNNVRVRVTVTVCTTLFWRLANFSLPWGPILMTLWNWQTSKNLGRVAYTGRIICKHPNLCYGHILLTAILPYCKSRPLPSLVHNISVICYCFKIVKFLRNTERNCNILMRCPKTRSSAVAEGPRDVHVIVKFSYVVTEYVWNGY